MKHEKQRLLTNSRFRLLIGSSSSLKKLLVPSMVGAILELEGLNMKRGRVER